MNRLLFPILLLAGLQPLLLADPNQAALVEKEGRVVLTKAGQPTIQAPVGALLEPKDRLGTGESSRAILKMSERWFARIDEETELTVTPAAFSAGNADALKVALGGAFIFSRESGSEVQILTPSATGGLRGTQILVRVAPDGASEFHVLEGRLELANPQGQINLQAGESGEALPGKPPRKTAVLNARSLLQWALYYPAVVHPEELGLSDPEKRLLADSLEAYRQGDLLAALDRHPRRLPPQSPAAHLYHAAVLLATGRVELARAALGHAPARHPARLALERLLTAVLAPAPSTPQAPESTPEPNPGTASQCIADSYFLQSRFQIPEALAAARRATELQPDSGFAWTRVGELEFSSGRIPAAHDALQRALKATPRNAQAHALSGFLHCADNRLGPARADFENAIALDPALANAWLGLGLLRIKHGDNPGGRTLLQTAATLEPQRSLLYSYHGKALSAVGLHALARKDLDLARQLDPADPTPWLYSGILHQQQNAYNPAVADLQESLRLNQNRRVYRSQFLLDQDRAVRSANLAKVYQNAGMDDLAIREAVRAVEADYSNASAHLFLSNAFDALRDPNRVSLRFETAWANELLLAFLLSPVGGGPLSQFVTQQEYSKLLEADGPGGSYLGEWRSDGIFTQRASAFLTSGRFSTGVDALHREDNGTRPNHDLQRTEWYWQSKFQLTPDDVLYSLVKWQDQESGDRFLTRNHQPLSPRLRFEENQSPGLALAGLHHRWEPGSDTLLVGGRLAAEQTVTDPLTQQSLLVHPDNPALSPLFSRANPGAVTGSNGAALQYNPSLLDSLQPFLGSQPPVFVGSDAFTVRTRREFEIYSAELQHIFSSPRNTLLFGSRIQDGSFSTSAELNAVNPATQPLYSQPAALQTFDAPFARQSVYAYDFFKVTPALTLLGGLAWDQIQRPLNFRSPPLTEGSDTVQRWNPKLGAVFTPSAAFSLRAAYTESLGGVSFDESIRLEPVQFAGFNQSFRTLISESLAGSVETPVFKTWSVLAEGALPTRTWLAASYQHLRQEVDRLNGAFELFQDPAFPTGAAVFPSRTPETLRYTEQNLTLGLNQLLGAEFAFTSRYKLTFADLDTGHPLIPTTVAPNARATDSGTLHQLQFSLLWNSPTGWFARSDAHWYSESLESATAVGPSTDAGSDDFWQFHIQTGYRFHRNLCEVSTGLFNVFGADYQLSPLILQELLPRSPTLFLRLRLSF